MVLVRSSFGSEGAQGFEQSVEFHFGIVVMRRDRRRRRSGLFVPIQHRVLPQARGGVDAALAQSVHKIRSAPAFNGDGNDGGEFRAAVQDAKAGKRAQLGSQRRGQLASAPSASLDADPGGVTRGLAQSE